jgi:hypothetical protein
MKIKKVIGLIIFFIMSEIKPLTLVSGYSLGVLISEHPKNKGLPQTHTFRCGWPIVFLIFGIICINLYIGVNSLIVGGSVDATLSNNSIFNVNSPQNIIYNQKKVGFNISSSEILSEISYINLDDPNSKWKTLCTSCNNYGLFTNKKLTMQEGINHLIIKVTDNNGSVFEHNVTLRVETIRPKILSTYPRENAVTNGTDFSITYSEENLLNIILVYGNDNRIKNITQNCSSGKKQVCSFSVNLSEFENDPITYNFIVHDFFDPVITQMTNIKVDTISPVVNINFPIEGNHYFKKVNLNITVSKKAKILYKDVNGRESPWKTLCTNCDKYGYSEKKFLSIMRGSHDLYIKAIDDAGNSNMKKISFEGD